MTKEQILELCKSPIIVNREVGKTLPNKTMTRRVIRQQVEANCIFVNKENEFIEKYCKFKVGDYHWIKEPAKIIETSSIGNFGGSYCDDDTNCSFEYVGDGFYISQFELPNRYKKFPSWWNNNRAIPNGCLKEMARYFIKVVSVKVERLQDITIYDIFKEGFDGQISDYFITDRYYKKALERCFSDNQQNILNWFVKLWNSTAPKGSKWEDNPFVEVVKWEYIDYE